MHTYVCIYTYACKRIYARIRTVAYVHALEIARGGFQQCTCLLIVRHHGLMQLYDLLHKFFFVIRFLQGFGLLKALRFRPSAGGEAVLLARQAHLTGNVIIGSLHGTLPQMVISLCQNEEHNNNNRGLYFRELMMNTCGLIKLLHAVVLCTPYLGSLVAGSPTARPVGG